MPKLMPSVVNIVLATRAATSPYPIAYVSPSGMVNIATDSKSSVQIAPGNEPDLSPNGKETVFWAKGANPGVTNLIVANINSKQKTTLVIANIRRPQFSPDGTQILFAIQQENAWRPTTIKTSGNTQPQILTTEDGANPAWLPNGRSLIWTTLLGIKEIDLKGIEIWSRPKPGPTTSIPLWSDRFSPHPKDSNTLVFSRLVTQEDQTLKSRLFILLPNQELKEIPTDGHPAADPVWFNDGSGILFSIKGGDGKTYIAKTNPDGTGFAVLFPGSQPAQ